MLLESMNGHFANDTIFYEKCYRINFFLGKFISLSLSIYFLFNSFLFKNIIFFALSVTLTTNYIDCMRAIHLLRSFVMVIAVWCLFAEVFVYSQAGFSVCVCVSAQSHNHYHHHHNFHHWMMRSCDSSGKTQALIWPLDKRVDFISIYHFWLRILQLMSSSLFCNRSDHAKNYKAISVV